MLIRAAGEIAPSIYLVNVGTSCTYCIRSSGLSIFDPGCSANLQQLFKKIQTVGLDIHQLSSIFITHLDPERVGSVPYLKKLFPNVKIIFTQQMEEVIKQSETLRDIYEGDVYLRQKLGVATDNMGWEEYKKFFFSDLVIPNTEAIALSSTISIRPIPAHGHSYHSSAYLIVPQQVLIIDESVGYFKLNGFVAPGADVSIASNIPFLNMVASLDVSLIGLPQIGALSGSLVRKHLENIINNTKDLVEECKEAFSSGMDENEIFQAIKQQFYNTDPSDPVLSYSYEKTLNKIWPQIRELAKCPTS